MENSLSPKDQKFTEAQLEWAIAEHFKPQGYPHLLGAALHRDAQEVLIEEDRTMTYSLNGAPNTTCGIKFRSG